MNDTNFVKCLLRRKRGVFVLLLLAIVLPDSLPGRGPAWRVERLLGSSQLAWEKVETLAISIEPEARLEKAIEDFRIIAGRRGYKIVCVQMRERLPPKQAVVLELNQGRQDLADGFIISRERTRLRLIGSSQTGLANALYTLAKDAFGARWYWDSEIGFELVGDSAAKTPDGVHRERPAFVQRFFSGTPKAFSWPNRLSRKYNFSHNLANIFNKDVFKDHPEAFAEIQGTRREPRGSKQTDPQPDLTEAITVELAAQAVRDYFDANPHAASFSLSTNDNTLFDQSAETESVVTPLTYFRGRPNYTDLVFAFANKVADSVFSDEAYLQTPRGDERVITALAYYWAEQSPNFLLHPRVMPILTSDRAQWHDPKYRIQDQALIQRWAASGAERIATWDYYFGAHYPYPRQFSQWIAESLPFLHMNGVDAFYGQIQSVWALDGPKQWLAAELLWNPYQDAEALLDEFYLNFFGSAGSAMRSFYEKAEMQRNKNAGPAKWIKFYFDEAGIEIFDNATMDEMRALLDKAKASVGPESRYSQRIDLVAEAFSFTESYHRYHFARRKLVLHCLDVFSEREGTSLQELSYANRRWLEAKETYKRVCKDVLNEPMHRQLKAFSRLSQSDPAAFFLAAVSHYKVSSNLALTEDELRVVRKLKEWREGGKKSSLFKNPDFSFTESKPRNFLGPEVPRFSNWRLSFRPAEDFSIVPAETSTGKGLLIKNADIIGISQSILVDPKQLYVLEVDAEWRVSPDNRASIRIKWTNEENEVVGESMTLRLPTEEADRNVNFAFPIESPDGAARLRLRIVNSRQGPRDFMKLNRVDVSVLVR